MVKAEPTTTLKDGDATFYLHNNPAGLTAGVDKLAETPVQMLARVLLPQEKVLKEFDVLFPDNFIPRWKIFLYLVVSFGTYAFVLCARACQRYAWRKRWCTPQLVEFTRGKMAVTSMGRMICWSVYANQEKVKEKPESMAERIYLIIQKCCRLCIPVACAAPVNYNVQLVTSVYDTRKIRQITQIYEAGALCCGCCNSYDAGLQVSIGEFNHWGESSPALRTCSSISYFNRIKSYLMKGKEAPEPYDRLNADTVLYIVTSTQDSIHDGDIKSVLADLSKLHTEVMEVMPELPDIFLPESKYNKGMDAKFTDNFGGVQIVKDNRTIEIPKEWCRLLPGEKLIASSGQVYKQTGADWFMSIITFGIYYFMKIREKKTTRTALILTTKRILSIDIVQVKGTVPSNVTNFQVMTRSFMPGNVSSGYVAAFAKALECGIETDGGEVHINFPNGRDSLDFALALQMSTEREAPITNLHSKEEVKLTPFESSIIALAPGEVITNKVQGDQTYKPFCFVEGVAKCSKTEMGPCYPICPLVSTCMLRPFKKTDDLIITDRSVISVIQTGNKGICGLGPCSANSIFIVAWSSIHNFRGYTQKINYVGQEWWAARCFENKCCGPICCPIGQTNMDISIDLENYEFGYKEEIIGRKDYSKDPAMIHAVTALGNLQDPAQRV